MDMTNIYKQCEEICGIVIMALILADRPCKLSKCQINITYDDIKFASSHFGEKFSMTRVANLNFLQNGDKFPCFLAAILN